MRALTAEEYVREADENSSSDQVAFEVSEIYGLGLTEADSLVSKVRNP